MGSRTSKPPTESGNLFSKSLLNSYEATRKLDADLQTFDATHQVRALSFDSLRQFITCIQKMNQQVVKVVLDCNMDTWNNKDLLDLAKEYFENSQKMVNFCNALAKCLKSVGNRQLLIHNTLQRFEVEAKSRFMFSKTLEELKSFKNASDLFTKDFFAIFQSFYSQQMVMLERIQSKKSELDKKLKSIAAWRKVSGIIFAATFAAVLICSVVATAVSAPPLMAATLAAATSIPLGTWIDSLFRNYEDAVRGQRDVINSLLKSYEKAVKGQREFINSTSVGTYVTIKELDNIKVLVDKLEIEIESLLRNSDSSLNVKSTINEVKKNLVDFMKNVKELGTQVDNCSRDIQRAKTAVLQRITKQLSPINICGIRWR